MGHSCSKQQPSAPYYATSTDKIVPSSPSDDKKSALGNSSAYLDGPRAQSSPVVPRARIFSYYLNNNNNDMKSDLEKRIASLEQELKCKDKEINSLQVRDRLL